MPKYAHSDGLYRKTESPVVESVRHTEGLYRKTKVAMVEVVDDSSQSDQLVKAMESAESSVKKKGILHS